MSTVTLAEIRFGIEQAPDIAKRVDQLVDWLTHRVRPLFAGRTLEVSEDVILRWRLLVAEGRCVGHTFSQPDLVIAATALHHGLTVARLPGHRTLVGRQMTHLRRLSAARSPVRCYARPSPPYTTDH